MNWIVGALGNLNWVHYKLDRFKETKSFKKRFEFKWVVIQVKFS